MLLVICTVNQAAPTGSVSGCGWHTADVEFEFEGTVVHWRGPAPYHFIALPEWVCEQIATVAKAVSYGWGVIPVEAGIGGTTWTTSLFPKDGGYLLPVKDAVRRAESLAVDARVEVTLSVLGL